MLLLTLKYGEAVEIAGHTLLKIERPANGRSGVCVMIESTEEGITRVKRDEVEERVARQRTKSREEAQPTERDTWGLTGRAPSLA